MIQETRPFLYFCRLHNMVSRIALFACLILKKKKKDERHPKRVNGPGLRTLPVTLSHIPLTRTQLQGYNIQAVVGNTTELWTWKRIGIRLYWFSIFFFFFWFSMLLLIVVALSFVIFFLILNFSLFFYSSFNFLKKMFNVLAFKLSFIVFKASNFLLK